MVGIVAVGEGVTELQPCDGSAPVALQGPALANLVSIAERISMDTGPVATIFADLVVQPRTGADADIPGGYGRLVDVMGVRRAAYEGFGCDGPLPSEVLLIAWGNEPFWRVEMRSDSLAELIRPEEGTQPITVGSLQQDFEGIVFTGTMEGAGTVFMELTTGTCQDGMSGALTHANAEFTVGGRRLRGCAWFGTAVDPDVSPVE
jgi:putative lipoprotein